MVVDMTWSLLWRGMGATSGVRPGAFVIGLGLLATAACSDDGSLFATPEGSTGEVGVGSTGGTTGTISTSATVTATGTGGDPSGADSSGGDSTGFADTGGLTAATTGTPGSDEGTTASADDEGTLGGSDSDGTGGSLGLTCTSNDDCVLFDDCCSCTAHHVDDPMDGCPVDCEVSACEAAGLPQHPVECRFGTCQLADIDCNDDLVVCDENPPDCPEGALPSAAAGCWTGQCVPPQACDVVPDCSWCADDETCVQQATQIGLWSSCEPIDPSCDGSPSCACMGDAICQNPYECSEAVGSGEIGCVCPVC